VATTIEELRQRVQLEQRLIARLKTASIRFTDAQVERIWAIISAHQAGLSIRKIAGATGLSSSRIHQLLNAPEGKEILAEPTATIEPRFRWKEKSQTA
jgi:transposase